LCSRQTSRKKASDRQMSHVLCKANEVFMVGVNIGDLNVDQ
jgi:hypothetical protein